MPVECRLLDRRASLIDRVRYLVALGIHAAGEKAADAVGEPVTGRGDQQVLEHLAGRVLPVAQQTAPRAAVAGAQSELKQQIKPILSRIWAPALVVERLPIRSRLRPPATAHVTKVNSSSCFGTSPPPPSAPVSAVNGGDQSLHR